MTITTISTGDADLDARFSEMIAVPDELRDAYESAPLEETRSRAATRWEDNAVASVGALTRACLLTV